MRVPGCMDPAVAVPGPRSPADPPPRLSHPAALDSFNPAKECLPLPGPGMFSAMFRKVTWPLGRHRHRVLGKADG